MNVSPYQEEGDTMISTMSEARQAYRDMLDEVFGDVNVAGMEMQTSRVLEEMDPIAFRCGFADWADAEGIDTDELEDDE